jgi:hypothetical protein
LNFSFLSEVDNPKLGLSTLVKLAERNCCAKNVLLTGN